MYWPFTEYRKSLNSCRFLIVVWQLGTFALRTIHLALTRRLWVASDMTKEQKREWITVYRTMFPHPKLREACFSCCREACLPHTLSIMKQGGMNPSWFSASNPKPACESLDWKLPSLPRSPLVWHHSSDCKHNIHCRFKGHCQNIVEFGNTVFWETDHFFILFVLPFVLIKIQFWAKHLSSPKKC